MNTTVSAVIAHELVATLEALEIAVECAIDAAAIERALAKAQRISDALEALVAEAVGDASSIDNLTRIARHGGNHLSAAKAKAPAARALLSKRSRA